MAVGMFLKEMAFVSALYLEAAMVAKAGLRTREEESTQTPMAHRTSGGGAGASSSSSSSLTSSTKFWWVART